MSGILATAHRLMFVAAGLCALGVVAWTSWSDSGAPVSTPLAGPRLWHLHEMLFGFAAAGFAGYTLTAMASWTGGRLPGPPAIAVLAGLWVLARLVAFGALGQEAWMVLPAGQGFTLWLAFLLGREAWATRVPRGIVQAGFALLLVGLQARTLLGETGFVPPVLGFALLLSAVGGRMVASFTRNRLAHHPGEEARFRFAARCGAVGTICIAAALGAEVWLGGWTWQAGALLLVAAGAETLRLAAWQDRAVRREGLLAMLHLGYLWLPLGLGLMGALYLDLIDGFAPDLLHALTAGAIACLIWAVAARAEARRADRLRASWMSLLGFAFLWLSALARVVQEMLPLAATLSPWLWCLAWTLFLAAHMRTWRGPSPRPVFSGPRRS